MTKPATKSLTMQSALIVVVVLLLQANAEALPFVVPTLVWQVLLCLAGFGTVYGLRRAIPAAVAPPAKPGDADK